MNTNYFLGVRAQNMALVTCDVRVVTSRDTCHELWCEHCDEEQIGDESLARSGCKYCDDSHEMRVLIKKLSISSATSIQWMLPLNYMNMTPKSFSAREKKDRRNEVKRQYNKGRDNAVKLEMEISCLVQAPDHYSRGYYFYRFLNQLRLGASLAPCQPCHWYPLSILRYCCEDNSDPCCRVVTLSYTVWPQIIVLLDIQWIQSKANLSFYFSPKSLTLCSFCLSYEFLACVFGYMPCILF